MSVPIRMVGPSGEKIDPALVDTTGATVGDTLKVLTGPVAGWAAAATGDEAAQDAVGGILVDSAEIDFSYNDATPSITADLINNSIVAARLTVAATQRLLGRNTAGAGAAEEVSLTQLLDWIGSAAQGDILYRGGATWARLPAGTSGYFLKTLGAGANPLWDASAAGYTDEQAQDAIGSMAVDTATINVTYADATPALKWDALATFQTLTDGATVTWTVTDKPYDVATLTLGGNRTLAITGAVAGGCGILICKQDGTGGRTLALPSGSKVRGAGAGAIVLSTAINKVDVLGWIYDGTNYWWAYNTDFT